MYKLSVYEKAMPGHIGWKEKLTAAKEAGYDGVELSVDESDERRKGRICCGPRGKRAYAFPPFASAAIAGIPWAAAIRRPSAAVWPF